MKVNSTELQNNFGKFLMLAAQEDIVITRNGTEIAVLSARKDQVPDRVKEVAAKANYGGTKASYGDFLQLATDSEERYEYIDGEIYLLSSPKTAHQRVLTELFGIFYNWFQGRKCRPFVAPYDITLKRHGDDINIVQPDIMVICDLEEMLNEKDYYIGIPTLIVEILSEGTRSKDLVKKLDLYMSSGVKEYWIVNPFNKEVAVYYFEEQNIFASSTYKKPETICSFFFEELQVSLDQIFK